MRYLIGILIVLGTCAGWAAPAGAGDAPDLRGPTAGARSASSAPLVDAAALECDSSATNDELLQSAREMFLGKNYKLSEMLYLCALARDPDNLSAILELSVVYEAAGRLQYAKALLSRAAIQRPFDQEIIDRKREVSNRLSRKLESEIDSLLGRGSYEAALPKLSALVGERPGDAELHYKKAFCYLRLGDAAGALLEIDKASRIQKDVRYSALRSEALALSRTKDVTVLVSEARGLAASDDPEDRERALAVLSQILERDPEHVWARQQFLRLSSSEDPASDALSHAAEHPAERAAERSAASAYARSAAKQAAAFAAGLFRTTGENAAWLVAALIVLIVFGSPLAFMIVRGFEPRQPLSGRLNEFNLQEILSLIHSQGKSGVLRVYAGRMKGRVYLVDGEIYHCTSGKSRGRDAVRDLLAHAKHGHFVLTGLPRSFKRTIDVPFSLVLMDIGERSILEPKTAASESPSGPKTKSRMKSLLENKG